MSGESGDLVPQSFAGDDGHLLGDPFVGMEVRAQLGVVFLYNHSGGLLHGLGANATHFYRYLFLKSVMELKKV